MEKQTIAFIALISLALTLALFGPDELAKHKAKSAASASLLDPDSAKFRSVRIAGNNVCGEINGKNAFGAYVGFKRFAYLSKTISVIDDGGFNSELIDKYCNPEE